MSNLRLLALAAFFGSMAAAQPALPSTACLGELTLERLAAADCSARIPIPSPRPEMASATVAESAAPAWEYIETPGAAPGETRRIRLVGSRFLPDPEEKIDFRARAASDAGPISALVQRAAAYFSFEPKGEAAVSETVRPAEEIQEARVALAPATTRN